MSKKTISRREFLKGAATGAAGVAAIGLVGLNAASAEATKFVDTVAWDAEYDVVSVGFGGAGAVAAITAADDGAKVLLLEKAPEGEEGGNTIYSGQCIMGCDDVEAFKKYLVGMCGKFENYDKEAFDTYAQGCYDNYEWLLSLGATEEELKSAYDKTGYQYTGSGFNWCEYPELEGSDHVRTWRLGGERYTGSYFRILRQNVQSRPDSIDVWYSSPAETLIQDPETKEIVGIVVSHDGKKLNIRAKGGIVLACGGFENNFEMLSNYLQQPYIYPYGCIANTGDGIRMSMAVGADLWHMSNSAGYNWGFLAPGAVRCITGSAAGPFVKYGIIVGPNGKRFEDESSFSRHGRINIGGRWISRPCPLPAWAIFDHEVVSTIKLARSFSENNVDEVANGWFVQADTLEELAAKLELSDTEAFVDTVDRFNKAYDNKEAADFYRPYNDTMHPIRTGPFYALKLGPTFYNTQGGPRHNKNAEIVAPDGVPIPHLYGAGEMGSIFCDMYNGGGNLGETAVFGRIAGHNAAANAKK